MSMNEHSAGSLPGKLIAVEGLDGSGKSTQISLINRWLQIEGYKVFFTEWNSSPLVRSATKTGKEQRLLTPTTFALIHCTDFADRYERQILPLLQAGYIVLADRYVYTGYARDAARNCSKQWIRDLYGFAYTPDLTVFFDVPPEVAFHRIVGSRPELKYYEAGLDMNFSVDPYESFKIFQGRIHDEYQKMIDEYSLVRIDATLSHEVQQHKFRELIQNKIDLDSFKWEVPLDLTSLIGRMANE